MKEAMKMTKIDLTAMDIVNMIDRDALDNDGSCNRHDVEGAVKTAASIQMLSWLLSHMGHETDCGTWADEGCERFAHLVIDGQTVYSNGHRQEFTLKSDEEAGAALIARANEEPLES